MSLLDIGVGLAWGVYALELTSLGGNQDASLTSYGARGNTHVQYVGKQLVVWCPSGFMALASLVSF